MSRQEGSSELYIEEACESYVERTEDYHCVRCGWEKMDHKPLTEMQVIRQWATGSEEASQKQAKTHGQTLLAVIDQLSAQASEWHEKYADLKASRDIDPVTDAFDDAGHRIDEIISETLDTPVPGTGGAWAIVIDGGAFRIHPTRFSAVFSAKSARMRGDHVDIYAEIYVEGAHSWELQSM